MGTCFYVSRIYELRIATYLRITYRMRYMKGIVLRKAQFVAHGTVPWDVPCEIPWDVPWDVPWAVPLEVSWDVSWDVLWRPMGRPMGRRMGRPMGRPVGTRSWIPHPGARVPDLGSRVLAQDPGSSIQDLH